MHFLAPLAVVASVILPIFAQFPAKPVGTTILESKIQPGVSIEYKQTYICETAPGVKGFSGYVHFPAGTLPGIADYNISTFFWYFEARHNASSAPLAIYLAGGPGEASAYGAVDAESGPCYVNMDANSTTLNPWSFNNYANMLYLDQPVQSGFSYDELVPGSLDVNAQIVTPLDSNQVASAFQNTTIGTGLWASQRWDRTTNNSVTSAKALWNFGKTWLTSFPEYHTTSKKISFYGNSYGGFYVPATSAEFVRQLASSSTNTSSPLHGFTVDTIMITNGCIDTAVEATGWPEQLYNNTYDHPFINKTEYEAILQAINQPGGCLDQIAKCRALGEEGDPDWIGNNNTVNEACLNSTIYCEENVLGAPPFTYFDIAVALPDPCVYYISAQIYLNQPHVQAALGVPLNFTQVGQEVDNEFDNTGDPTRKGMKDLEYTLQSGVKVTMLYGDRDYKCPWTGAENVANAATWAGQKQFEAAGYEEFKTNQTYVGGAVKQFERLSFMRLFDSGHEVTRYQPETVYRAFQRAVFGLDAATGTHDWEKGYKTTGPKTTQGWRFKLPVLPKTCCIAGEYQPYNVWDAVLNGTQLGY